MVEVFMTADGKKQLEERLRDLKVNGRADMADKIRVAREFGDLSENAEYDIAKEEQAKMESEIMEIEAKLRNVTLIDEKIKSDRVDVGSRVEIRDETTGIAYEYTIVGTHESNPMEKRISNESPIGKSIMGKKKGDDFIVYAPKGDTKFKLVNIK